MKTPSARGSFLAENASPVTVMPERNFADRTIWTGDNPDVMQGMNSECVDLEQEPLCAGCRVLFPLRNFTVDHIIPRSRGGTDQLENLQLPRGACNSRKGDRPPGIPRGADCGDGGIRRTHADQGFIIRRNLPIHDLANLCQFGQKLLDANSADAFESFESYEKARATGGHPCRACEKVRDSRQQETRLL